MRLQSVKVGDIIRVAGNMHALVIEKHPHELVVRGIGNNSIRRVKAGEVEKHWRAGKST